MFVGMPFDWKEKTPKGTTLIDTNGRSGSTLRNRSKYNYHVYNDYKNNDYKYNRYFLNNYVYNDYKNIDLPEMGHLYP